MSSFKKVTLVCSLVVVAALTYSLIPKQHNFNRYPAQAFTNPFANELGETWSAKDQENSSKILSIIEDTLDESTAGGPLMKRDAHPKHHGCVAAQLQVDSSNLPAGQQVGVFTPGPKSYDAWIRFSNGNPNSQKADADGDVRGMAMKLINIPGSESGSQDFLLMNSKTFFIKSSDEYLKFMSATESTPRLLWFLATHAHTRRVILAAQGMKVGNPLHIDYHSATPYKLGNRAVKYSMRTCVPESARNTIPKDAARDFLKDRLADTLSKTNACFDFYVQISKDPKMMPVEDATIEWSEQASPLIKVARLVIPKQTGSNSPEQMKFCENLSMDPWHTLPEQRPLGNINRVRLQVYSAISKKRHEYNHIPMIEPKTLVACSGETEVLCK